MEETIMPTEADNCTDVFQETSPNHGSTMPPVKYYPVNVTKNETCYLTEDLVNMVKNLTIRENEENDNRNENRGHQIVVLLGSAQHVTEQRNMCFSDMSISTYFLFGHFGDKYRISCEFESNSEKDECVCNRKKESIQVNDTYQCFCFLYRESLTGNSSNLPDESHHFRRNCTILSKANGVNGDAWIATCSFVNSPFSFEEFYFNNISDEIHATPIVPLINNMTNTTTATTTTKTTTKTATTTTTTTATTATTAITAITRTENKGTSAKSTDSSKTITTKQSSLLSSIEASNTLTQSSPLFFIKEKPSTQTFHTVSTNTPNISIMHSSVKSTERSHIETSSPTKTNVPITRTLVLEGEKGERRSFANPMNHNSIITNPIFFFLFLFLHLCTYYGFFRRENVKKRNK